MKNKKIVVVGATSAIAQSLVQAMPENAFLLLGRSGEKLKIVADDIRGRGATSVETRVAEVGDPEAVNKVACSLPQEFGDFDMVVVAHGNLPDQEQAEQAYSESYKAYAVNFLSVVALLTPIANYFETRASGTIVVIGSVAGDRGRQSNYVYGSAKGGLALFLQGLRNRLKKSNVHVLTVKPGFVDTPMTAHLKKGLLFASPDAVARGIVKAIEKGRNEVYLPWFWQPIMCVIRAIPEAVFKRMSL